MSHAEIQQTLVTDVENEQTLDHDNVNSKTSVLYAVWLVVLFGVGIIATLLWMALIVWLLVGRFLF